MWDWVPLQVRRLALAPTSQRRQRAGKPYTYVHTHICLANACLYVLLTVMHLLPVLLYSTRALLTVLGDAGVRVHHLVPSSGHADLELTAGLAAAALAAALALLLVVATLTLAVSEAALTFVLETVSVGHFSGLQAGRGLTVGRQARADLGCVEFEHAIIDAYAKMQNDDESSKKNYRLRTTYWRPRTSNRRQLGQQTCAQIHP